jgi:hypothetical protein
MGDAYERLAGLGYERGDRDFANHGPMGSEALCALGFGDDVAGWVEDYKRRMAHHDPPQPRWRIDGSDEQSWRPALGSFSRVGDWEELFNAELTDTAWRDVLARWWPRLLPGLLAALTHGLIRTAHAVRCLTAADHSDDLTLAELARGLAYWAARFRPLPDAIALGSTVTVADAVAQIPRGGAADAAAAPRPQQAAGGDETAAGDGPVAVGRRLSELTITFAGVYLAHPEIPPVPLIHAVTAPAAMRLALSQLPEGLHAMSLTAMWRAHIGMLQTFTRGTNSEGDSLSQAAETSLRPWYELHLGALEHGDEHVIKFTEACSRENALQPDPRFAAAASAAQQRIPRRPRVGAASQR